MILTIVLSAVAGAVVFGLVIRNNPSLGKKLGLIVDKIEEEIKPKKAPAKKTTAAKKK
jgi:hypothetical protein